MSVMILDKQDLRVKVSIFERNENVVIEDENRRKVSTSSYQTLRNYQLLTQLTKDQQHRFPSLLGGTFSIA